MAFVETIRQLWQRKVLVGLVLVARRSSPRSSPPTASASPAGPAKSARCTVAAASSQILVDSPDSTLVEGARLGHLRSARDAGQNLRPVPEQPRGPREIAKIAGVPAALDRDQPGPSAPPPARPTTQAQSSEDRAGELLQEGAANRLVFTAQEGVPILTVDAQAADRRDRGRAGQRLLRDLEATTSTASRPTARPVSHGVTVRELGAPEGGTLGGSNDMILMVLAFLARLRPRLRRDPRWSRASPSAGARSTRPNTTEQPTSRASADAQCPTRRPAHGHNRDAPRARPRRDAAGQQRHHEPAPSALPPALMEAATGVGPFVGRPATADASGTPAAREPRRTAGRRLAATPPACCPGPSSASWRCSG